jgi:hypothetical protein
MERSAETTVTWTMTEAESRALDHLMVSVHDYLFSHKRQSDKDKMIKQVGGISQLPHHLAGLIKASPGGVLDIRHLLDNPGETPTSRPGT